MLHNFSVPLSLRGEGEAGDSLSFALKVSKNLPAASDLGCGAEWAGQGAPLARSLPAAELIVLLHRELQTAQT